VVDVFGIDGNHLVDIVRIPALVKSREEVSDRLLFVAWACGIHLRIGADDGKEGNDARDEEGATHRVVPFWLPE
jgi:hypothetical protein